MKKWPALWLRLYLYRKNVQAGKKQHHRVEGDGDTYWIQLWNDWKCIKKPPEVFVKGWNKNETVQFSQSSMRYNFNWCMHRKELFLQIKSMKRHLRPQFNWAFCHHLITKYCVLDKTYYRNGHLWMREDRFCWSLTQSWNTQRLYRWVCKTSYMHVCLFEYLSFLMTCTMTSGSEKG